uniref:Putative HNH nuclease YajD n=1 Tax=uncultured bacterium fosmid pJB83B9 TaxID=1478070 RepID=A0A0H3U836_9BACT|nr:hypothetical protein [uncultured bacterium fosmid pJB83B9]
MPTIKLLRDVRKKSNTDNSVGRRKERHEIYDTVRWRRTRELKFLNNPICEMCEKKGRITPTEEIHHVVSFMSTADPMERRALAFDFDNLMSLCSKCHHEIHGGRDYSD